MSRPVWYFLTPVFTMILGFGSSDYLGNPEEGLPPRRRVYMCRRGPSEFIDSEGLFNAVLEGKGVSLVDRNFYLDR